MMLGLTVGPTSRMRGVLAAGGWHLIAYLGIVDELCICCNLSSIRAEVTC